MIIKFRRIILGAALPLMLMSAAPSQAQPKVGARKGPAIRHAEQVLGKPLSASQQKAVRAAQKQRLQAIKPIQQKFRADVAKALGLSVAQFEAREKALRQKKPGKTP